jgi:aspartyl-tRNA(Asn)/glutamyl-tRNA(Gln) amidotransferase subunit A
VRLAFTVDMGHAVVDPEVAAITERAAHQLARSLGVTLRSAHPGLGDIGPVFEALVSMDTDRAGLRRAAVARGVAFVGQLGQLLAREWTADEFTAAIMERKRIVNALSLFMQSHDFLLTPTTAAAAFDIDRDGPAQIAGRPIGATAWTPFSAFANLSGQPAISVPAGFTQDGRPVGLQIVGRHQDDLGVLRLARAFERVCPWPHALAQAGRRRP